MKYHDLGKHHLVMLGLNDSFDRTLTMSASMLTSSNIVLAIQPKFRVLLPVRVDFPLIMNCLEQSPWRRSTALVVSVSPSISKIWIIPSL
ncbi:hypothetical protein Plhal304r1_c039g0116141 [Plasmopara halstedii]